MSVIKPPSQGGLKYALLRAPISSIRNTIRAYWECEVTLAKLRREGEVLARERDELQASQRIQVPTGTGEEELPTGGNPSPDLEDVLCKLKLNDSQQRLSMRDFARHMSAAFTAEGHMKFHLAFYPWVSNAMDLYTVIGEISNAIRGKD